MKRNITYIILAILVFIGGSSLGVYLEKNNLLWGEYYTTMTPIVIPMENQDTLYTQNHTIYYPPENTMIFVEDDRLEISRNFTITISDDMYPAPNAKSYNKTIIRYYDPSAMVGEPGHKCIGPYDYVTDNGTRIIYKPTDDKSKLSW